MYPHNAQPAICALGTHTSDTWQRTEPRIQASAALADGREASLRIFIRLAERTPQAELLEPR